MKSVEYRPGFTFIFAAILLYACGGGEGNTGTHVTQIDSVQDSTAILQHEDIPDPDENTRFATGNAVKVELDNAGDFNWEDFRNELSAKEEAVGEGFSQGENEVATAWEKFNERYSYQTVYSYRNGELWLQTYYKGNNPTSGTDSLSNEEGKLLTKDAASQPEFKELWDQMEERAQNIFN